MTDMTKTDTFAGRVALITGAGQGIGRVFAKGFARAGAKLAIVELTEDSGRSVEAEVEAECGAGTVIAIRADGADRVGRAARWERVCQYVSIQMVTVKIKQN